MLLKLNGSSEPTEPLQVGACLSESWIGLLDASIPWFSKRRKSPTGGQTHIVIGCHFVRNQHDPYASNHRHGFADLFLWSIRVRVHVPTRLSGQRRMPALRRIWNCQVIIPFLPEILTILDFRRSIPILRATHPKRLRYPWQKKALTFYENHKN